MAKTIQPRARFSPAFKSSVNVAGITPSLVARWSPILAVWGFGAAVGVAWFASDIPKFKSDVLDRIPVVRQYFIDKTPDSDKPF